MKHIRFFICVLLLSNMAFAQTVDDDMERITIHPLLPRYEHLPSESAKLLETKLMEIVSNNGVADNKNISRFVLTAKVNVVSKDIVAGPPQRISQKIELTLMIGDIEEDKVFATHTISAIGIGQSLDKAYISAFKNIKANNSQITLFVQSGKEKIIQYYEHHCHDILSEARKLATSDQYEQSLLMLTSIPNVCESCYNECAKEAASVYNNMINARGLSLLKKAQSVWAKNPTKEGAKEASRLISQINYAATCQPQVVELLQDITAKMKEIDQREWEFQMQQYNDNIEREKREWEQHLVEYRDEQKRQERQDAENAAERRMIIKACRDVAIEYARHQPTTVNYYCLRSTRIYAW